MALPPDPWQDLAQVVGVRRSARRVAGEVEVAVILRTADGRYTHRRTVCKGSDLKGALPHLFKADPEALAYGGDPSVRRRVHDQRYDSFEQALRAAQLQDRPAYIDRWMAGGLEEQLGEHRLRGFEPKPGRRIELRSGLVVALVCAPVFGAAAYVGYLLDVWLGLNTTQTRGSAADSAFTLAVLILALVLAIAAGHLTATWFRRRNSEGLTLTLRGGVAPAPRPWDDKAQVLSLRPTGPGHERIEVAIIARATDGRYTHRRLRCDRADLTSALPHLFDADPQALRQICHRSAPGQVKDQHFDTADQAMVAAQTQSPPARPACWVNAASVRDGADEFIHSAERVGLVGSVVAGLVFTVVFVAVISAVVRVFGDPTSETGSQGAQDIGWTLVVAGVAAAFPATAVAKWFGRRHWARAGNR